MPTATYTPMANVTLGSSASTVTFSSISQSYRDLVLVVQGTNGSYNEADIAVTFNGSSASAYYRVFATGDGSTTGSGAYGPETSINILLSSTTTSAGIINIMDYSATDKHKTTLSRGNLTTGRVSMHAGRWANTAAITSIGLSVAGNFQTGSTFALYGISA